MTKTPTIIEFMERFPDDATCLEHLKRTRYGERHDCEKCGRNAKFYRVKSRTCYTCEHCGHQVYPMAGTAFEKSRTSLRLWFYAMYLFCVSRHGVSAKELERQLGVTYKTAWRMAREIRKYMGLVDGDGPLGGIGSKHVEIDKAFFGGVDKKGHDDKSIVLGMVEREGEIVTRVIPDRTYFTITSEVLKTVLPNSRIATDTAPTLRLLAQEGYRQETVNHRIGEYVRGDIHTNTLEGFWALVQRSIQGTHVWVSPKHLQTYLGEFEFRWNLRKTPHLMFDLLCQAFPRPAARS